VKYFIVISAAKLCVMAFRKLRNKGRNELDDSPNREALRSEAFSSPNNKKAKKREKANVLIGPSQRISPQPAGSLPTIKKAKIRENLTRIFPTPEDT
jgi:hypothetical protein